MGKPLISICIPTRNRCEILKLSILSIVSQQEFIDGIVEIVVSDNASDDNTQSEIMKLKDKYPSIKYHRNESNKNATANCLNVLGLADGKLRKLSNDTIIYRSGSMKKIFSFVKKNEKTRPVLFWANGNCRNLPDGIMDFRTFVTNVSYWVTWIGGFSIWEDDIYGLADEKVDGIELWQVRKTYELAERKNKAAISNVVIGDVCKAEKQKNLEYGVFKVFYTEYTSYILPYLNKGLITSSDFSNIEEDLLYNYFTQFIIFQETKSPEWKFSENENLLSLVKKQYSGKLYWNDYWDYYRISKMNCLPYGSVQFKEELSKFVETTDEWSSRNYDVIFHVMKNNLNMSEAIKKIPVSKYREILEILCSNHDDFAECVSNYVISDDCFVSIKVFLWYVTLYEIAASHSSTISNEKRWNLICTFIDLLSDYISNIYNSELLNDEDIEVLPELHQFGYYVMKANESLLNGKVISYLKGLEKALSACPSLRSILSFMIYKYEAE